jgi:hypothetical protein
VAGCMLGGVPPSTSRRMDDGLAGVECVMCSLEGWLIVRPRNVVDSRLGDEGGGGGCPDL